jgi:hypothetical protein
MNNTPAFPQPINPSEQGRGMTLRDYFAAKAMQGLFANGYSLPYAHLVRDSYGIADMMLKAREV